MSHNCSSPADTILQFFRFLDDAEYKNIPRMFASDGIWYRRDKAHSGPDAVKRSLAEIPPIMPTVHLVTNLQIEQASPRRASAVFYVTALRPETALDGSAPWPMALPLVLALYSAELVGALGDWQIQAIRNRIIFRKPPREPVVIDTKIG